MFVSRCSAPPPWPPKFNVGTYGTQETKSVFYFGWPIALHGDAHSNIELGGAGGGQPTNFMQGVFYFANTGMGSPANLIITARAASKFCARSRSQIEKIFDVDLIACVISRK